MVKAILSWGRSRARISSPAVSLVMSFAQRTIHGENFFPLRGRANCLAAASGLLARARNVRVARCSSLRSKRALAPSQWFAEFARHLRPHRHYFGGLALQERSDSGPAVGLYITAAYWFTASTSFLANPAVTIARALDEQLFRDRASRRADVHCRTVHPAR